MRFLPLSWGELSFSMSLTEVIFTRIIVYLEGKEWQAAKKKPNQTKQETLVRSTTQHCDCYHVDTNTIHTRGTTSPEGRTLKCRAASVPTSQLLSLGTYPPAHPSPGTAAASRRTGTETAELFSQPRTHLFVCTLL